MVKVGRYPELTKALRKLRITADFFSYTNCRNAISNERCAMPGGCALSACARARAAPMMREVSAKMAWSVISAPVYIR